MTKYFIFWPIFALVFVSIPWALIYINSNIPPERIPEMVSFLGLFSLCSGSLIGLFLRINRYPGWISSVFVSAAIWAFCGATFPHIYNYFDYISGDGGVTLVSIVIGIQGSVVGAVFGIFVRIFNEPKKLS